MHYRISFDDKIIAVSDDWDAAARSQNGEEAVKSKVIGGSVWGFVTGTETRSYLNALFYTCRRTQLAIKATYRCDTPNEARLFKMEAKPLDKGGIEVGHQQLPRLTAQSRAVLVLEDMGQPEQCSQCLSVQVSGQWVDPVLLQRDSSLGATYVVCPHCRTQANATIKATDQLNDLLATAHCHSDRAALVRHSFAAPDLQAQTGWPRPQQAVAG